jgi:hypothetical protein
LRLPSALSNVTPLTIIALLAPLIAPPDLPLVHAKYDATADHATDPFAAKLPFEVSFLDLVKGGKCFVGRGEESEVW